MSDNAVLFNIQDLCKSFGDHLVLDHISTEIKKGEVVVIIGPSGSGKSTFLRSLNLLEEPTGGVFPLKGWILQTLSATSINTVRKSVWYSSILISFLIRPFWKI